MACSRIPMSSRRLRLVLAPEADRNLRDALMFSEQRWGKAQQRAYLRLFSDAFAKLRRFPELGRPRTEVGTAVRSHRVGQHVVFYGATETELVVSRIVHVRRDVDGEP